MGEPEWQGLCGKIHGSVCGSWQCSRKADHDGSCSPERPAEEGPKWPAMTPSPAGGGEVAVLVEFGIFASKMATSQWKAACDMATEITRLRTALAEVEGAIEKGGHRCGGRYRAMHSVLCSSCRAGYDEQVVHFISGPALRDLEAFIRAESHAAAERAGAERALRWAYQRGLLHTESGQEMDEWAPRAMVALFPPPGADVGRDAPICTSCGLRKEKCDGC